MSSGGNVYNRQLQAIYIARREHFMASYQHMRLEDSRYLAKESLKLSSASASVHVQRRQQHRARVAAWDDDHCSGHRCSVPKFLLDFRQLFTCCLSTTASQLVGHAADVRQLQQRHRDRRRGGRRRRSGCRGGRPG